MPGFVPCVVDQKRLDYHAERLRIDKQNRRAIRQGTNLYDQGAPEPRAADSKSPRQRPALWAFYPKVRKHAEEPLTQTSDEEWTATQKENLR